MKETIARRVLPFMSTGSIVFLPSSTMNQAGERWMIAPRRGCTSSVAWMNTRSTSAGVTRGSAPCSCTCVSMTYTLENSPGTPTYTSLMRRRDCASASAMES